VAKLRIKVQDVTALIREGLAEDSEASPSKTPIKFTMTDSGGGVTELTLTEAVIIDDELNLILRQ
jgi:hypothetical protein